MRSDRGQYVVAIVGGATAGAEIAGLLAARGVVWLLDTARPPAGEAAERMADWVGGRPALRPEQVEQVLGRVRARQRAVGYDGAYREWIARVTPPDLA